MTNDEIPPFQMRTHQSVFIRLLLVAAFATALAAQSRRDPASGAVTPWEIAEGPYAGDPRMPALVRAASGARREALDRLRAEWGLSPGPSPIRWTLDTRAALPGRSASGDSLPRSEMPLDFELGRTWFEGGTVHVSVPARRFLWRPGLVSPVVRHECVHAVHASRAKTRARYESTPRWLREGIALLFSGEGRERVMERLAYTVYGGAPATSFLTGIHAAEVTQAEAYLAAEWLRARLGERFPLLVRRIASGEPARRAVAEVSGIESSALADRAKEAARDVLRELLPESRARRFRSLLRESRAGRKVSPQLEVLLAEDEDGPLAGTIRYLLAREALRGEKSPRAVAGATRHLEVLRAGRWNLWRAEALVLVGQCYLIEGRRDAARRAWTEVTEVFGEDRDVADQARRLLAATRER